MLQIKPGMTCPQCEKQELVGRVKNIRMEYAHKCIVFMGEKVVVCGLCGFESAEDIEYVDKMLTAMRDIVNERGG